MPQCPREMHTFKSLFGHRRNHDVAKIMYSELWITKAFFNTIYDAADVFEMGFGSARLEHPPFLFSELI